VLEPFVVALEYIIWRTSRCTECPWNCRSMA